MQRIINTIEKIFLSISLAVLILMTFLTTFDTGGRYLLNSPIPGSYELIEKYFMIFAIFLALGTTYRMGGHIRLTFIEGMLVNKQRTKLAFNYIAQAISIFFNVFLLVSLIKLCMIGYHEVWDATKFKIPLFPAYLVATIGMFFVCVCMIIDFWCIKSGQSCLFKDGESENIEETTVL
ncbi:MAG: TRAP transporter small permease [Deltaproteobacteria bacterium]|nr:TRAP transporter small permease [Deltaproteobacteria bacterium]